MVSNTKNGFLFIKQVLLSTEGNVGPIIFSLRELPMYHAAKNYICNRLGFNRGSTDEVLGDEFNTDVAHIS